MLQLTIELPESLSEQVESSGLSRQQLGRVITYLLEMYLKIEQSKAFIQITATGEIRQDGDQVENVLHHDKNRQQSLLQNSNLNRDIITSPSIVDQLAGSLGPALPDELDYFNTADLAWERFAE